MKSVMKKAVIYVRVSTDKQAEKGTSLDTQIERCKAYAGKEGYKIIRTFKEEGESAKFADRPELLNMLAYLQTNKDRIDALIVYKLDRLSRNTDDQHQIMYKLSQAQVVLTSATENIDDSPVGKFMRGILWGVAELDNAIRAERTRDGMYKRFKEGIWPFPAPTGYIKSKEAETGKTICEPHPEYGSLVMWAAKQRAAGYSYVDVASGLRKRGFKMRGGNDPYPQSVWRMMHNPFYHGTMRAFGETKEGRHTPLIPPGLYLRVKVVDDKAFNPAPQRSKYNEEFPVRLRCSKCKMNHKGSFSTSKTGKRHPYYHHYNKECPLARSFKQDTVHVSFEDVMRTIKPKKQYVNLFKKVMLDIAKSKAAEHKKEGARFGKKLAVLREEREKIVTALINDPQYELLDRAEYIERKAKVDAEIESVQVEQAKFQYQEINAQQLINKGLVMLENPAETWEIIKAIEPRVEFQRHLFPKGIEWDGEKCRTPKLSVCLETIRDYSDNKSRLAAPRGIEPLFAV